jgi:cold shock protein
MKGTVKFFNTEKKFGFVTGEDGKDYFVHQTALKNGVTIKENDAIEFDTEQGDKGMRAINVVKQ